MANNNENTLQTQEVEKQEVQVADGAERTRSSRAYIPRADIYETENELVIVADMPGVDQSSLDLTLEKNVLNIKGYIEPLAPANYSLAYAEYEVGDYERSFTLSDSIDKDNISANVKDGVLHVYLPKAGPAKSRKIAVQSA
jgi:HSP20 family molecular chaperone IbpA